MTLHVKGLAGKTSWPVDNVGEAKPRHFVALVCFLGRIHDPAVVPEVYIVPSAELQKLTYFAPGGRRVIPLSKARALGAQFWDGWKQLT